MQVKEVRLLSNNCKNCFYSIKCNEDLGCDYYFPMIADAEQAMIDELVEEGRYSFRDEWFKYIEENDCNL